MSRGLSTAQLAAAAARHRQAVPLIEALFDSGTLRLAVAPWDIVIVSDTYTHTGSALRIADARESGTTIEGLQFVLSGLNSAVIALATGEPFRGRVVRLLKCILDADTNEVIGPPVVKFVGRMQNMLITDTNSEATITIIAEHYDVELTRPYPIRLSDADQQRLHPGDLGCSLVAQMAEKVIIWPAKEALEKK